MKSDYQLQEADFLHFQLFAVSQSKAIRKRRAKGRIFLLLIYGLLGIFIWERSGVLSAAIFFILCLPLYFLYRYMEKRQYEKHFRKYTREQYNDFIGKDFTLSLEDDMIISSFGVQENRIPVSQLTSLQETASLYIINSNTTHPLIFPKTGNQHMWDALVEKANGIQIPVENHVAWKWK